jgi:hypothetical protein
MSEVIRRHLLWCGVSLPASRRRLVCLALGGDAQCPRTLTPQRLGILRGVGLTATEHCPRASAELTPLPLSDLSLAAMSRSADGLVSAHRI